MCATASNHHKLSKQLRRWLGAGISYQLVHGLCPLIARLTHSGGYHEPFGVYIDTSTAVSNTVGVLLRPRRLGSHVPILLLQDLISSSSAKSYPD